MVVQDRPDLLGEELCLLGRRLGGAGHGGNEGGARVARRRVMEGWLRRPEHGGAAEDTIIDRYGEWNGRGRATAAMAIWYNEVFLGRQDANFCARHPGIGRETFARGCKGWKRRNCGAPTQRSPRLIVHECCPNQP